MRVVNVSVGEHDLLTVARALVREGGFGLVEPILRDRRKPPEKLSPAAMDLLQDTLARGTTLELMRRGGWRREKRPAGAEVKTGRLWERNAAPKLSFTAATFKLIYWLCAEPIGSGKHTPLPVLPLSAGDELVVYLVLDLVSGSPLGREIAAEPAVQAATLAWLAFPDHLLKPPAALPERMTAWLAKPGAIVVTEALQQHLAARWVHMERDKRALWNPVELSRLGQAQQAVLAAFLAAVDRAGRRDLAAFLLEAVARLVPGPGPGTAVGWVQLDPTAPLSDRSTARRAAGSLLRAVRQLRSWTEEHRLVRFFDDNYEAAQAELARWEALGDAGAVRADQVIKELETLEA